MTNFTGKPNFDRFIQNNPKSEQVINKYKEEYLKEWGDQNNTSADNNFMRAEAWKVAVGSPEMLEAFHQAREEYIKDLENKLKKLSSAKAGGEKSDLYVEEGALLSRKEDVFSGEQAA